MYYNVSTLHIYNFILMWNNREGNQYITLFKLTETNYTNYVD